MSRRIERAPVTFPPIGGPAAGASAAPRMPPVMRSEGQRMLLYVTGTLDDIASALECCTSQAVHQWRTGAKMPGANARARLMDVFGIPSRAWSMLPGCELAPLTEASSEPAPSSNGSPPSTLEDCLALLAVIRRDRMQASLLPGERVKLADAEARILALRARLEEAAQFAESKYVASHPSWIALKRAILKALEPHTIAMRAVAEAIAKLEGGS